MTRLIKSSLLAAALTLAGGAAYAADAPAAATVDWNAVGIVVGAAIIVASIVLTGIYVVRANAHYDELTKAIVNASAAGGK